MKRFGLLVLGAFSCVPALAVDYSVGNIGWTPADKGPKAGPSPIAGQDVFLTCEWAATGTTNKFNNDMVGQIFVDGKPQGPPRMGVSSTGLTSSASWHAIAGTHKIRCTVDSTHLTHESNEGNNSMEITLVVTTAGFARPMTGGNVAATDLRLPDAKTRACKSTLWSTVTADASQFSPAEAPDTSPAKMTLDLVNSAAMGNFVHCEYQSVHKDVKIVYTLKCSNAHASGPKHTYACD